MIRGTTPTFKLRLKDTSIDLTKADNIYVSFSQKKRKTYENWLIDFLLQYQGDNKPSDIVT